NLQTERHARAAGRNRRRNWIGKGPRCDLFQILDCIGRLRQKTGVLAQPAPLDPCRPGCNRLANADSASLLPQNPCDRRRNEGLTDPRIRSCEKKSPALRFWPPCSLGHVPSPLPEARRAISAAT